jgi:hypothetical protein
MSYTNPWGQTQGKATSVTNKLRQILVAEIIAINAYYEHILNSNMDDINRAWHNIMLDEKKHYGMALKLLRQYDPTQYKMFQAHKADRLGPKTPMQFYNPDYNRQIILNNIRADIKGELEAIILYEEELAEFRQADIRTALQIIIDDEKEHTEHLTELLLKYDPDPYGDLD